MSEILVLSRDDVARAVSFPEAIAAVREAYASYSAGQAAAPVRTVVGAPRHNGTTLFMPGYVPNLDALGAKVVSVYADNPKAGLPTISAAVLLVNPRTGEPLALMEGGYLTALRTGAGSAVAAELLARRDARVAAVIGCGVQARTQVLALAQVRALTEVRAVDVDDQRAWRFAAQIRDELGPLGTQVYAVMTTDPEGPGGKGGDTLEAARAAVCGADIIITATTSRAPVFPAENVGPGTHINAIGAFTPEMREIPEETLMAAGKVYVDSAEGCWAEAGDLLIPLAKGRIGRDRVGGEIGEVVAGRKPGRENATEITIFKAVGMAVLDMAVGMLAYRKAVEAGQGTWVDIG